MIQVGRYQVSALNPDQFRLDGGAMFGSVPKTLWSKRIPADEANRIQLACRVLILRGEGRVVLVEAGMGRKWQEKEQKIFAVEYLEKEPLERLVPGVTDIILTHLHFDHAAGVTVRDGDAVRLAFPDATVHLQAANWERAQYPGVRERASYLPDTVKPLAQAKLKLARDGQELLPDVHAHVVGGHTQGLQWLVIGHGEGALAFPADLIPTSHHISIPYVMGYDLCAETTMREKEAFLKRAIAEQWIVVFYHDAEVPAAKLCYDDRGQPTIREVIKL